MTVMELLLELSVIKMNTNSYDLFHIFLKVQSKFNASLENFAASLELNKSELLLLLDVIDNPKTSLNDVCKRKGLKKSAASKLIDRLIAKNLIAREICTTNRREIRLTVNKDKIDVNTFCTTNITKELFSLNDSNSDDIKYLVDALIALETIII